MVGPNTVYFPLPNSSITSFIPLTGLGGDLGSRALGTHLALDSAGLATGGSELGLLGLLLLLGLALLLLGVLNVGLAGGEAGLGAHAAALLDHIEGGSDDATLGLHDTASALLRNFLGVVKSRMLALPCFFAHHRSSSVYSMPFVLLFRL